MSYSVYIIMFFLFLLGRDLLIENVNKNRAELYCRYRLRKDEKNEQIRAFFEKELQLILQDKRDNVRKRYKWFASRWQSLSEEEKLTFIESNS